MVYKQIYNISGVLKFHQWWLGNKKGYLGQQYYIYTGWFLSVSEPGQNHFSIASTMDLNALYIILEYME